MLIRNRRTNGTRHWGGLVFGPPPVRGWAALALATLAAGCSSEWVPELQLSESDTTGEHVAIRETHAAVSTPGPTASCGDDGIAVYERADDSWQLDRRISTPSDPAHPAAIVCAQAVRFANDTTLAIGYTSGVNVGMVDVYWKSGAGFWSRLDRVEPPDASWHDPAAPTGGYFFGGAIAAEDHRLVVGANRFQGGQGKVEVYERVLGGYAHVQTLQPVDLGTDSNYGYSVALHGNLLAVGRAESAANAPDDPVGRVYLYQLAPSGMFEPWTVVDAPLPQPGEFFGREVALTRSYLAVRDSTTVFFYELSAPGANLLWSAPVDADEHPIGTRPQKLALHGGSLIVASAYDGDPYEAGADTYYFSTVREYDATGTVVSSIEFLPSLPRVDRFRKDSLIVGWGDASGPPSDYARGTVVWAREP